jgi:membrane associated rhomboid family serine protease
MLEGNRSEDDTASDRQPTMNHYGQHYYQPRPMFRFPRLTPAVKTILYINIACFVLQLIFVKNGFIERWFALWPQDVIRRFYLWQLVTAMFLHGGVFHILLNMLPLTIFGFGPGLERFLGTRRFYAVYFMSGIGGNLLFVLANLSGGIPAVGASGAVCGVLAGFAMAFPERWVFLLIPPMPVKVKWIVLVYFGIEVLSEIGHGQGGIAHSAHVGGFIFGWAYMKIAYKMSLPFAFIERMKWRVRRLFSGLSAPRNPFDRGTKARKYRPIDDGSFIDEEVDPILDKISKQGMGSLTARERRILRRARQHMGKG